MAPQWLDLVAWASLTVGFASALLIGADIALSATASTWGS
jgi:hypothetical protein